MNILILGGTGEARELADRLVGLGHDVTTSLAGRTASPLLPKGDIRVGKFGGIPGLVGYLQVRRFDRLVDATHPYAGLISVNAVAAAARTGIRLVRFMRAPWLMPAGAEWIEVADVAAAAAALPAGAMALDGSANSHVDRKPPTETVFDKWLRSATGGIVGVLFTVSRRQRRVHRAPSRAARRPPS